MSDNNEMKIESEENDRSIYSTDMSETQSTKSDISTRTAVSTNSVESVESVESMNSIEKSLNKVTDTDMVPIEQITAKEIKQTYPELPKEEAIEHFEKLYAKWISPNLKTQEKFENVVNIGLKNFGLMGKEPSMELIDKAYQKNVYQVLSLFQYFKKNKLEREKDPETNQEYYILFNKVLEIIYYTEKSIRGLLRMQIVLNPSYDSTMNDDIGLFKFESHDTSKNTPYQNLILYLLRTLHEKQLRRYGSYVYEMNFINGVFTYSWKEKMTIKDFVHTECNNEKNWAQWHNATKNKSNIRDAIDYLENCDSAQFPVLNKDRHIFAFNNGVYITKFTNDKGRFRDYFYRFGTKPSLKSKYVACKYFDQEFNNFEEIHPDDWYTIPTPNLQRILDYQYEGTEEHEEICRWMYIFIGKLLYEIKELERWQILPFLNGIAGSGKSTIIEVIRSFFESKDVGVMENTIEEKFGLAPICDKYIFVAPEIKKNFSLDQALFQKVVSGEEVCLPVKNKDPKQIVWLMPGFMASNELPGFIDSAGSISRRLVVFKFTRIVDKDIVDPNLMLKLKEETGAILKKCNLAYLSIVNKQSGRDIWSLLPRYFHDTREALGRETNPLKSFLGSGRIVFPDKSKGETAEDVYCKEKDFKDAFNQYCADNNISKQRWSEAMYSEPYAAYAAKHRIKGGIKVIRKDRRKYPRTEAGRNSHGTFIVGMDLAPLENQDEFQN